MRDGGGYAGMSFPDPPKGSPGGVRGAAAAIRAAGRDMHAFEHGLTAAQGALNADWSGDASIRYRTASSGLSVAAGNAATTFAACAAAVDAYADALEHAQDRIRSLHGLWQAAMSREASLGGQINGLAGRIAAATGHEADDLQTQMSSLGRQQTSAHDDAERYAREARATKHHFEGESQRHAGMLNGQTAPPAHGIGAPAGAFGGGGPFSAPGVSNGMTTPGFGIPSGGLSSYDGTAVVGDPWNSDIPGYGVYMDATHPVQETDDLTNAILFVAGGVGVTGLKALGMATKEIVSTGAARLGIGAAGRDAVDTAGKKAFQEVYESFPARSTRMADRIRAGRIAERDARAKELVRIDETRGKAVQNTLKLAKKAGVKLPEGTDEIAGQAVRFRDQYKWYTLAKLAKAEQLAAKSNSPASQALARALHKVIEAGAR